MPNYKGRHSIAPFEIPISRTKGKVRPPIGKKDVPCDIECKEYLTAEQKAGQVCDAPIWWADAISVETRACKHHTKVAA